MPPTVNWTNCCFAQVEGVNIWNVDPVKFEWILRFWAEAHSTFTSYLYEEAVIGLPPFVCIAEADVAVNTTRVGELLMGGPWGLSYWLGDGALGGGGGGGGASGSGAEFASGDAGGAGRKAPLLTHVQHLWGDNWGQFERANFGLVCAGRGPPPRWAEGLLRFLTRISATRRADSTTLQLSVLNVASRPDAPCQQSVVSLISRHQLPLLRCCIPLQIPSLRPADGALPPLRSAPARARVGTRRRLHAPRAARRGRRRRQREQQLHVRALFAAERGVCR